MEIKAANEMGDQVIPSVDEIIATLSRSSLPTVIIEGVDDVVVYRRLEDIFSEVGLSVMPVHGRKNVLRIFERLAELKNNKNIAFIADKDLWVISGVPPEYVSERLIFTDGYSIENDIFKDCRIRNVMEREERELFDIELDKFIHWYALTVSRVFRQADDVQLKIFVNRVLDDQAEYNRQITLTDDEVYPVEIYEIVKSDIEKYLRGKSLMQIATRHLMKKGRIQRINPIFFLGTAPAQPGPLLSEIFSRVESIFVETENVKIA